MEKDPIRPVEIKDLNKTQLILLAILLSFITSIATGIVTVALMQQAPTAIVQPINRVVQQTIEKVVPNYVPGKTQTVIVKEDDLVVTVVEKTQKGFFPLLLKKDSELPLSQAFSVGKGVFVSESAPLDPALPYLIKNGDVLLDVKVVGVSPLGFAVLKTTASDAPTKDLPAAVFGNDAEIKNGATMLVVTKDTVQKSFIQYVGKPTPENPYTVVKLNTAMTADMIGGVATNLEGNIIGMVVPKTTTGGIVIGIDAITKFIANPVSTKESVETPKEEPKQTTP